MNRVDLPRDIRKNQELKAKVINDPLLTQLLCAQDTLVDAQKTGYAEDLRHDYQGRISELINKLDRLRRDIGAAL